MKLEMGESLIASWLKHQYGCQIVQLNWKPADMWDICIPQDDVEGLLKQLKNKFTDLEIEFTTETMKSSQLIKQGEIDCFGICLKTDETDNNRLIVDKIYAVDVAFHEYGLNYGSISETCKRIRKKFIRSALSIYQYLGTKDGEIIFASPKAPFKHLEVLKKTAIDVHNTFEQLGFNYDFKIYCNDDFNDVILHPICTDINKISDTSELFIRSLKLINLFDKIDKKNSLKENKLKQKSSKSVTNVKIAVVSKNIFEELSIRNALSPLEIENLCNAEYSKKTFGLYYAALVKFNGNEDVAFVNGRRRYYSKKMEYNGHEYLLCNDWFERQRNLLEKWYDTTK